VARASSRPRRRPWRAAESLAVRASEPSDSGPSALPQPPVGAHAAGVTLQDAVVAAVLRSPLHRALSGSTDLVRYTGRRTGRVVQTPTQYARDGQDVVILVRHPERKTWWRNFRDEREVDLLLARHWTPMTARAVIGADDPALAQRLLETYRRRFPHGASGLRAQDAVLVRCRPR
jgi:deazaflavin-dependent oxidoreductase (nitroreductase family)